MSAASKTGVPMSEQIRFINKYRKSGTTDADWYQDDDSWDIQTAFLNYPDKVLVTPGQDS